LERLAQDKLASLAAEVKAEGWAWVDATPGTTHADLQAFQRAPRQRRSPNQREAQRIQKLQTKMQALAEAVDSTEERRVGTECVRPGRSRWTATHYKTKN